MEADEVQYIGFFKRILIYWVELLIFIAPMIFLYRLTTELAFEYQSVLLVYLKWIVVFAFNLFLLVVLGGSIGKLMFRVRVVNSKGNYPTIIQALIRYAPIIAMGLISANNELLNYGFGFALGGYLIRIFSIGVFLFILLDVVFILFNKERRALHDYMADTYVIRKESMDTFTHRNTSGLTQ